MDKNRAPQCRGQGDQKDGYLYSRQKPGSDIYRRVVVETWSCFFTVTVRG